MKILVVSQYFWPENFRVNELVGALVRRGHHVTVLTGIPNYPDGVVFNEYSTAPSNFSVYEGAQVVRVPMLPRGSGKFRLVMNYLSFAINACLVGAWKLRGKSFDVIFTFEPSPITVGIPSAFMRRLKRAPQIFWVLDLWPDTLKAIHVLKSPWMLRVMEWLVRWVYKRCDLLLAQSKCFVTDIRRYAGATSWIEYFPAWAEGVFLQGTAVPAPELERLPNMFNILFAGNIGEAQDFPAILEAATRLKHRTDVRWIIVGDGRVGEWVKRQVMQRDLGGSVVMLGRHPLTRMPEFFAHADALLVSLRNELVFSMTIPGKLQSYFAVGTPILAMLNGEGARIVEAANAGLVCAAGDAAGLAENVLRLLDMDHETRAQLGENGRRLCQSEFDRDTLITRLEGLFEQLMHRAQRTKPVQAQRNL